jgi:hypothetical protein
MRSRPSAIVCSARDGDILPSGGHLAETGDGEDRMNVHDDAAGKTFDVAYLALSGTTTAVRCPALLRELRGLGFSTVIAVPTPNVSRVIAPRDVADVEGVRLVES